MDDGFEGESDPKAAVVDLEGSGKLKELGLKERGEEKAVGTGGYEELQSGAKISLALKGGVDKIVGLEVAQTQEKDVVEGAAEMFSSQEIGLEARTEEVLSGQEIAGQERA